MADELGLPLAEEKTEGPTPTFMFWGIELDTVQQMSKLAEKKIAELKSG